jgi:hypothetical protein
VETTASARKCDRAEEHPRLAMQETSKRCEPARLSDRFGHRSAGKGANRVETVRHESQSAWHATGDADLFHWVLHPSSASTSPAQCTTCERKSIANSVALLSVSLYLTTVPRSPRYERVRQRVGQSSLVRYSPAGTETPVRTHLGDAETLARAKISFAASWTETELPSSNLIKVPPSLDCSMLVTLLKLIQVVRPSAMVHSTH